ncbi:hypothetical protein BLA23254_06914 [Burkholderia lata]|uniref:Uncharacterized protein n=1 Tax=Burkholderia lata (strain ATCC 17760 / DSM 23089 / LMG 22485 / NCIMB 9086 / R18194 / 383) TaxID=482957 RepID=A0A6P2RTT8_BURL3|nr:hypothetical protein [Burkholderia lata]VWC40305.1 hypothetical protein BLA23254_06914 [Burkholderia lata]
MATASLIDEIQNYAAGRRSDVARGAETPAFAALMVEKYGEGLAKAAHLLAKEHWRASVPLRPVAVKRLLRGNICVLNKCFRPRSWLSKIC